jgi:acyl CoA:acetate/3-ketoacid CoA transferase
MNIAYSLEKINLQNVFFLDSKKNIIMDGKFTKIIYSDSLISTSGISAAVPFRNTSIDKTSNRNLLKFSSTDLTNIRIATQLIDIERDIIDYYKNLSQSNKTPVLTLRDHIKNGCIKIYRESFNPKSVVRYVVKISGIWEDQYRVGLTYKFIETYPLI